MWLARFNDSMKEIDVALTDYGLTILYSVIVFMLARNHAFDR